MSAALQDLDIDDLLAAIKARADVAFGEGYEAGFQAGHDAAVKMFQQAAATLVATIKLPDTPKLAYTSPLGAVGAAAAQGMREALAGRSKAEARAPRGLVAEAIREVLTEAPGLRVIEVVERVAAKHPEIAAKSVGNQMRRGERDGVYERIGKYKWYLKGQAPGESSERPLWDRPDPIVL
ncbi:hypothetical protein [uncultured Phenylobacterium sp.]|uniref:hypothetical protein n=1 Tax=uncultured Phenylobacterium sp. TaxID=349273 RepID=UPI0025E9A205|nr:hypothetical protein [uncultured Phenylobacterium sp.]